MIGKFGYIKDCSLLHYIPQGRSVDGHPVIVFPQNPAKIIPGDTYDFTYSMTRSAVYIIDGITYRVAHAIHPQNCDQREGDLVDLYTHQYTERKAAASQGSVANRLDQKTVSSLMALKASLGR